MTPIISDADAAFLASYDVDADDPAAPEMLQSIGNQVAAFTVAWLELGPDQFFRHLGMQIARMHADLDKTRADLRLFREFHAPYQKFQDFRGKTGFPRRGDTIN